MVCAFPVHLWFLLMVFMDFGWVGLRTNIWDAIGLVSYSLFLALIETVFVFLAAVLAGRLLPAGWESQRRLSLLGLLVLVLSAWSIAAKAFGFFGIRVPAGLLDVLASVEHPLRLLWGFVLMMVLLSVVLPVFWMLRKPQASQAVMSFFDRLVLLSSLYIFLDFAGLAVILIRNLSARAGVG
jgi:hypothetical protein